MSQFETSFLMPDVLPDATTQSQRKVKLHQSQAQTMPEHTEGPMHAPASPRKSTLKLQLLRLQGNFGKYKPPKQQECLMAPNNLTT